MKKSVLTIVIIVAVIALMASTAVNGLDVGYFIVPSLEDGVVLGLDLVGGSEITYDAVIPAGTSNDDIAAGMDSAQTMLRQRLNNLGYTEANVYLAGETRVVVEIPNVDDPEEAVQQLGTTAVIEFQDADGNVLLDGNMIESAQAAYGPIDDSGLSVYHVVLTFNDEGRELFKEATKAVANRKGDDNYVAIVMDGTTISSPFVDKTKFKDTGIDTESAIIQMGDGASMDEVKYLADIISAGKLPFTLENVKLQAVGASLGEKSLETSLVAGLIGLIIIAIFMIAVYRLPGIVSVIALMFYAGMFAIILAVGHINLTLPGIAGIILTIGMAVDANVIIFERIREELRSGKTIRAAIDAGYNRAFAAILDSNITTAIAAVVLWWQGTGTIMGFAKTLLIGVIVSMFTMLVITRILLRALVNMKVTNIRLYGVKAVGQKAMFDSMIGKFSFVKKSRIFAIISLVLVITGLVGIILIPFDVNLFNFDIDFLGGVTMEYDLHTEVTADVQKQVNEFVREVTGSDASSITKAGSEGTQVVIKTLEIPTEQRDEIFRLCAEKYGLVDTDLISSNYVSASVGGDIRNAAIIASVTAALLILVYITIRFEFRSGCAAVIALIHDLLVMLSMYIILQIPFNMNFIAAALTILGYSINATIVVFDRIRENNRLAGGKEYFAEVVDKSIWQTLTRSLYTTVTTLFPVVMIYILGVSSIKNFALPLIIGIVAGGYSSICISGAMWCKLKAIGSKKEKTA
ncbi:MAG: protein translocase subunit SecD [Ruminococcaceae bacterium]|nr:protein translocase subunit SecD [Oscillospiraceae bacterium]